MPPVVMQHRRLVSQDDAAMIARPDVPRSKFSGSFSVKFTFDAGYLIPFHVEEVYPGDHFTYQFTPFVRTGTPLFPIMDSQRIDIHCFFHPNRLAWVNWEKLMGQQDNPSDSIAFSVPQVTSVGNGFIVGSPADYMGLPTIGQGAAIMSVNALPFRAYANIYNKFYRDENLINSAPNNFADTSNTETTFTLRRRAKSHDYFTSCLPWPQKFVAPSIASPVTGIGVDLAAVPTVGPITITETPSPTQPVPGSGQSQPYAEFYDSNVTRFIIGADAPTNFPQVFAQTDVNLFRQAIQVQTFLERMARGGTRYTEITENIFGVRNPDARLQRPEYIGGGSTPLQFTPIAQTAPTAGVPLGALGATGAAVGNNRASYAATEHGFIICIMSVKSELSYSQGVHKMWDRRTLYDYYNPAFAGLGEQAVKRREIYATGVAANDDVVFGYQERWHELRTHYSRVARLFRPTTASNIDEWHLSQQFTVAPTLGQTFIEDTPPMTRVLAAGALDDGKQYLADVHVSVQMVRPLPAYGTPDSLGRF